MKTRKQRFLIIFRFVMVAPLCMSTVFAQAGGTYQITKSVIAGGGGATSGGTYQVESTVGQAQAAPLTSGGTYSLEIGFWTSATVAPTAAMVSVSGRVVTSTGRGITNVSLVLTDSTGVSRTARTGTFGFYRFDNIVAGQSYVLTIKSRRFIFDNSTRFLSVMDNISDVDFIADVAEEKIRDQ